ncbi:uncharacterized protein LOC128878525 isoform X1 [Hylaeus volcanicus]|uniref:uncharacterized protein LOC128878525 isoform X1 n=2 Tax=Hylaeus volcanicus TaxID=313075 RepID=UPI0023B80B01|nr:uncharacterized protein LOC128878525 isoform X1 [Hylaeus volcanicus]
MFTKPIMAWLFGKKKYQKDLPPESVEEEQSSDNPEGFVFIKKRPAPPPPVTASDAPVYPGNNLYPSIPPVPIYSSTLPIDSTKDHNHGDGTHYLNGVPFKMSKQLESSMNNDLEIDRLRISEILSFIEKIQNQNYKYDFTVEEGVIAEMNSTNE